jgi:hypothetical protein
MMYFLARCRGEHRTPYVWFLKFKKMKDNGTELLVDGGFTKLFNKF